MLKAALIKGDEVVDSEGLEFTVLFATPVEGVLELSPLADPELFKYYTIDRNEQGVWIFRDDPSIYLVDLD